MKRAVTRWEAQQLVAEYMKQLRDALRKAEDERPNLETLDRHWQQDAREAGLTPQEVAESWVWFRRYALETAGSGAAKETMPGSVRRVLLHNPLRWCVDYAPELFKEIGLVYVPPSRNTPEHDWRRDAEAIGLSPDEINESWTWFRSYAFEAPPVLEEAEQRTAREAMPNVVRRVLTHDPMWWFVGYDHDLLDDLGLSIQDDTQAVAEEQLFWDDIGCAFAAPTRDRDARNALDRIAKLVHLQPGHVRRLTAEDDRLSREAGQKGTTIAEERRRLVQTAILLSLGVAQNERLRLGSRTGKGDPGHPITLEETFGRDGLGRILATLAETDRKPLADIRDGLERSLGGPFRPADLADRAVYRNWLIDEIRRRTVGVLEEDLDTEDADRAGGGRRKFVSYSETEPLASVSGKELGPVTREHTEQEVRATGEREERERASFRITDQRTAYAYAAAKKDRMELNLAHRIDFQRTLDRVWREHDAPEVRRYVDCVREEPLLWEDDAEAARRLVWRETKVRDVKRRTKGYIAQIAAEQRWKTLFPIVP